MDDLSQNMNKVCRVCLTELEEIMVSVYSKNYMNVEISSMMMYCTSVKIMSGDGMPEYLCKNCLQRLEIAYLFKQECEQSEDKLRSFISSNMNPIECKTEEFLLKNELSDQEPIIDFEKLNADSVVKVELNVMENEEFQFDDNDEEKPEIDQYNLRNTLKRSVNNNREKKPPLKEKKVNKKREYKENYICKGCNKPFSRHNRYWMHRKVHPFYTCYVCFEQFNNLDRLVEHGKEHTDQMYVCAQDDCDQQFTDCNRFILHKKNEHEIINYLHCSKCDKSFHNHEKWDLHIYTHQNAESFECKLCEKKFSRRCYVVKHMQVHTRGYKCDHCEKSFSTARKLRTHSFLHGEQPFSCQDCTKKFSHNYKLQRHINVTHKGMKPPKREKRHLCAECGQVFARPIDLTVHIRIHTGVKPFSCDLCEYRCHDKQLLKSHSRVHSGLRPYKCSYCEKSFSTRGYLTIHERFHSGYRPYICSNPQCRKGFTNSKDLKVHERTHTGIKLFHCTICGNSFTTLHYLRVHMKKHDTQ